MRAVEAIEKSQKFTGGWTYHPTAASGRRTEFTLSVWQMMGLKAALLGGVDVKDGTLEKAMDFVRDSTHRDGGVMYYPGGKVTLGATGAGLFARCMFGLAENDAIDRGLLYMSGFPDQEPELGRRRSWEYVYYWYYRTLVAFQLQGREWRDWNRKIRPYLVNTQRSQGHGAGSWAIVDYGRAGTVYSTALCVLTLETYYRYLPMVRERSAIDAVFSAVSTGAAEITPGEARRLKRILKQLEEPGKEEVKKLRDREREEGRRRLKSKKPEDRYLGARALAKLQDKDSLEAMVKAAEDAPQALKPVHLIYIGQLRTRKAIPYLMGRLGNRDRRIRGAAMSALTTITSVYIAEVDGWRKWYRDHLDREAEKK